MEYFRPLLCFIVPVSLLGFYMNYAWAVKITGFTESLLQAFQMMPVDGTEVFKTQSFEEANAVRTDKGRFCHCFQSMHHSVNRFPYDGYFSESSGGTLCVLPLAAYPQVRQAVAERTYIFGDAHFIVVQDYDHWSFGVSGIIQCFIAHTAGESSVSHQRNGGIGFAQIVSGSRQPQCS